MQRRYPWKYSILLVTHRLEGVTGVDEILVLQDGRVTQRGTHDALVALPGWYQQRWREPWLGHAAPLGRRVVAGRGNSWHRKASETERGDFARP